MKNPLVSVVIPTYKRPHRIEAAIESVKKQTFKNLEIIVVDDNDPDSIEREKTHLAVQKYSNENNFSYITHEENKGGAFARNTGINASSGNFIAFLDDDDYWFPEKIEKQISIFESSSDQLGAVYCGNFITNDQGKVLHQVTPSLRGNILLPLLNGHSPNSTSLFLLRKSALVEAGGFDSNLKSFQDYDLWINMSQKFEFDYTEEPLVNFVRHNEDRVSINFENRFHALEYISKKWEKLLDQYGLKDRFYRYHASNIYVNAGEIEIEKGNYRMGLNLVLKSLVKKPFVSKNYIKPLRAVIRSRKSFSR